MPYHTQPDWQKLPLSCAISRIETGTSVNGLDRPKTATEKGVLKMSAITDGKFNPYEHKAVIKSEEARVSTPVRTNTIIMGRKNTPGLVGATAYCHDDLPDIYLSDLLWQLHVNEQLAHPKWLSYLLRTTDARSRISSFASGTSPSMKGITKSAVLQLVFAFPPLPVQRRIVEILDEADAAVRTTQDLLEAKVRYKQAVAELLLTGKKRFAEFEGQEVSQVTLAYVFSEVFEVNNTSQITHVITVGKHAIRPQEEHFTRSVASKDLSNYRVIYPHMFVYDPMSAYYGAIGRYDGQATGIVSPAYRVLKINPLFSSDFFKHLLKTDYMTSVICHRSTQGNKSGKRRTLAREEFNSVTVKVPTLKEQERVAKVINELDEEIGLLKRQLAARKALKEGLMQKLLSGEVPVTPRTEDGR